MVKRQILKFQLLNNKAKLPVYDHNDDAAFGIFSTENKMLNPKEFYAISTGIA